MTLVGEETYVKEKHMLNQERITVFTQEFTDENGSMLTQELVFKEKGTAKGYLQD